MRSLTDLSALPPDQRGAVIALGSFDGVHLGHRAMLAQAWLLADRLGAPLAALTFEPHPRQVLRPQDPPFRLTDSARKAELLEACGVDILYQTAFTPELAAMPFQQFERDILAGQLEARGIVAGLNFLYGKNRQGSFASLAAFGAASGIVVEQAHTARDGQGEPYSSTRIRQALGDARPDRAAALLGRFHDITYTVEQGDQRGRTLGFPTANGRFGERLVPAYGIYAIRARLVNETFDGVANIGIRPMWRLDAPLIETHLFDFDRDIYGRTLRVELLKYLRPEQKFSGIPALVEQIGRDCGEARLACHAATLEDAAQQG